MTEKRTFYEAIIIVMKEKKARNTILQIILTFIFTVLAAVLFFLLDSRKNHSQQQHLQLITERYQLAYNTIYDQYKQLATTLHSGITKRFDVGEVYQKLLTTDEEQKNRLRKELLAQIRPRYEEMQKAEKVRQLHFHLQDNESFLRFHRPEKFGDNLTDIRQTVNYVNTEHSPIDGFEEGRIYNGFRFVFPITAADQSHLGSMEISFGPETLTSAMMKQYFVLSNFLIKQAIIKKKVFPDEQEKAYRQSYLKGYLFDKNALAALKKVSHKEIQELKPQKNTIEAVFANAHSGRAMSFYDPSINMVITTIPVLNPVTQEMVAFFTVRNRSDFFMNEKQHFRIVFSLSLLLLLITFSTFYIQYSKRKILEANTKQLEKQRHQLLDAQKIANLGHWDLDLITNHLSWSDQVYRIFGLQPEEVTVTYESFLERVHPGDRDFVNTSYTDSVKKRQLYDIQHRIFTKDGAEKWVREICTTEFDETGKPLRSRGIIHDITKQEQAKDQLLRKTEEWEKTINAIPDIITMQDKNMKIVRANQAAFDFFQMEPEELLGSTCYSLFRGATDPCSGCPGMSTLVDTKKHTDIIEHKFLGKTFQVCSAPILDPNSELQYFVYIAQDITDKKRLEEELFQAQKMEAIGTLAGGIAHDFNNILSAILGYAEIAKTQLPETSQAAKDIDQVLIAGQRATELVKQILTFSRKTDQQKKPLRIDLIVKEALKLLRSSLPATIDIQASIDNKDGLVLADPTSIHQIVVNLCTNASHAIGNKQGKLEVTLGRVYLKPEQIADKPKVQAGPFVLLTVKDSGIGMDEKTVARIFEPYFTTKKQGKGTGLGLAVIHGIVEDCNGFIEVESVPGKGTAFQVYLPAIKEELSAITDEKDNIPLPTGNERILVIDNEPTITDIDQAILTSLGYRVTTETKSTEALGKFRATPEAFDLVITDQTMPELTGAELAQAMLKLKPDLPIILCTGYTSAITRDEAHAIGIKSFAVKPLNKRTLAETVRRVLDENSKA